jgi:NADH:ubiquinone oxidoreductase subunit K
MKDIVINHKRQKIEILTLLICFLTANITNICCIVGYGTKWNELYTQIIPVLCITVILYGITIAIRLLIALFRKLTQSRSKDRRRGERLGISYIL